ncbi:DUF5666 domain-containing protein [Halalkalibaculum sp. DA384]|uniref:DUF5666 domain-containing protein n=1 Tax=Halalkalibaculum sp. DA384 TaxID=3373606 RepID=UPI003754E06D
MNTSKSNFCLHHTIPVLLVLLLVFAASCTLDGLDDEINDSVTQEDLQAASQILGESLSSDNSGLMLSLNDALTTMSTDGFVTDGTRPKANGSSLQNDDSGRGNESNYSYSYDAATGIHTISFTRSVDRPLFSKTVTDTLKYIFRDNNGNFVELPRRERERIESIDYNSYRQGSTETPSKTSSFLRTDTLIISGVSSASSTLRIDGVHNGSGTFRTERAGRPVTERGYQLEINFLNIEIDKAVAGRELRQGVTGTLTWEMSIEKNTDGNGDTQTLTGTIEMNGDRTALLRFQNFLKIFHVNLDDGDVKDVDREFEGRVTSVNEERRSFTLRSGREVFVNDQTEFDDDYRSLRQVRNALQNGTEVWAEGEGYREGNRFLATEVEFEREDDGDDIGEDGSHEFEARVTSVNLGLNTVTLAGEVVVRVNSQTVVDDDSDYRSLQEVSDALARGVAVVAEGEAVVPADTSEANLRALEISFETEDENSDDDDNDD